MKVTVSRKSVAFKNGTLKMAGHLYVPDDIEVGSKRPAIVCIHPGGGVKEQVIGLYARRLAELGFITLAFDATHQGESEGEPRLLENPIERVEDARCAADFLSTLKMVDDDRMAVFGICAGGGYAISAAQTERRFKAVGTVSAVEIGGGSRDYLGLGTPMSENWATLDKVTRQRTAEARGGEPLLLPIVPDSLDEINENTPVLLREGYEYYRTPRGQHPNSPNRFRFTSTDRILAFSAFDQISNLLTQPLLLIVGSIADTRYFSEQAYGLAKHGPKEVYIVNGATHIALYDVPEYVNQAITKLASFFRAHLTLSETV